MGGRRNGRRVMRDAALYEEHTLSDVKVSRQFPLVLLIKVDSREGKAFGRGDGTVMRCNEEKSKYYIKIQSVPQRKRYTSPLQRSTG
jgi:ribosomal protein L24E